MEKEEGGRNFKEEEPAGRDWGIPWVAGPSCLAHLGTWGSGRAGGGGQCPCPGDSAVPGWGGCGTSSALPVPGAHLVVTLEAGAAAYQTFLGPPSHAPPWGGGGRVGVGRPGPAGPVRPGAPVVWGACHFKKAGPSGAGTEVGGRMRRRLQTHKYRRLTGGPRRARVRAGGAPRVSQGPGGSPLPSSQPPG